MKKKTVSILLALCMILGCVVTGLPVSAKSDNSTAVAAAAENDYGLAQTCEDGVILHCFNWTLNQIKEELPRIAEAGFTSVQTSPLQRHDGSNQWYWLYQPTGFTLGNEIGSYSELKELCTEADRYGVKIIVDVVTNHLAGQKNGTWSNSIENNLKQSKYFHNKGECTDNNNRYDVTHKNIGMPDLNSENAEIQNMVLMMITSLKNAGVDGIRWDAAKHISLPSEGCSFWETVTLSGLYHYGEILDAPAGNSGDDINNALMAEYAQYIGVTDEGYSSTITGAIRDGRVAKSNGNWNKRGVSADKIVYWAESHDTYGNNGWTNSLDQNVIDRAYAILAARADSQTLYLSRPFEKSHTSIKYAKKGSTHFTSDEVAAVNRFHNAMIGMPEKYQTSAGCYVVCRGGGTVSGGGAVIVSPKGSDIDVSVTNGDGLVPSGTYTDEVSGSTWTVADGKISGHIGSTGIAVIYRKDSPSGELRIGDADLSGDVSILDATAIQRYLAMLEQFGDEAMKAADCDLDETVTVLDATLIQRYLADLKDANSHVGELLGYAELSDGIK